MASASSLSKEEKAQITAKLWILEYSCRRICRSFVNYKVNGSAEDQEINSFYTIMSEMTSALPSAENLDDLHRSLILMSEMCLRLLKKDFEFSADDNFRSINDFITYLCYQYSIKPEKRIQLHEFFNAQRVLTLHSAGLYKEAKCMFAKLKGEMFFEDAVKYIIQSSCAANISKNMSFENFLDSMQKFVGFLLKHEIGPSVLEQTATLYHTIDVESRLDHSEMLSLFRHHMEQMDQESHDDVDLNIPDEPRTETSSSAAEEVPSRKRKKYRKLFSHSQVHIDISDSSTAVSEGAKRRNPQTLDETSNASTWLSTRKINIAECSATSTRPGDEESEGLAAKSDKQARNVNNRELAVVLNNDVEAAGDIIAAFSAAAEANAEDADADDADADDAGDDTEAEDANGSDANADDAAAEAAKGADAGNAQYAAIDVDSDANAAVGNQDDAANADNDGHDEDDNRGEQALLRDVFRRRPMVGGTRIHARNPRVGVEPLRIPDIADDLARPLSPRVRRHNRARPLRFPEEADDRDADPVVLEVPPLSPRMRRRDRARLVQEADDGAADPVVLEVPPLSPRMRRRDRARLVQEADDGTADPVVLEVQPLSPRMRRRDRARLVQEAVDGAADPVVPEVPPLSPPLRRGHRARPVDSDEEVADGGVRGYAYLERAPNSRRSRHNESDHEVSSSDSQRPRRSRRHLDDDDSSPDGDDSFFDVSTTNGRRRRLFTAEEEDFLRRGVRRFGVGRWAQILNRYNFNGRTAVNLKDKWRNMMRRERENQDH